MFACALAWPGWCRAGKTEQQALDTLAAYAERYAAVAREGGIPFPDSQGIEFDVVERLPGSTGYTDFGVPGAAATSDSEPLSGQEAERQAALVRAAWVVFGQVVSSAPAELRKGPRGGGRDRDKVVDHVLGAETAYARKLGVKHRQPARGDTAAVAALREDIIAALQAAASTELEARRWLPRYAARRIAWHVLDHAWEIEDRS